MSADKYPCIMYGSIRNVMYTLMRSEIKRVVSPLELSYGYIHLKKYTLNDIKQVIFVICLLILRAFIITHIGIPYIYITYAHTTHKYFV